jgi:hypothetical protein
MRSGTEQQILDLSETFVQAGHPVTVVVPGGAPLESFNTDMLHERYSSLHSQMTGAAG